MIIIAVILAVVNVILLAMVLARQSVIEKSQTNSSQQMMGFTQLNEQKLESIRQSVERKLGDIQQDNAQQLERMRNTVDEKLQATLEKRLGESFKIVSDRLEKVHQGLGEMQSLASGVGDLKRVLSNVKTRGTWGEARLENILEQILSTDQYVKQFSIKKNRDVVDFAVKFPGQNDDPVYLPIDAKFPTEDYERLVNAQEAANVPAIEEAAKALETRLKTQAKSIAEKYLDPPFTTEFALLFLPTEGLYAEALRRPGLGEKLRQDYKVILAGPMTITVMLDSFNMGFRTLAVQKRANEVWGLLGAVKNDFTKFADLLEKTKNKLDSVSGEIEDAVKKSRRIEKKLGDVQQLPSSKPLLEEALEANND